MTESDKRKKKKYSKQFTQKQFLINSLTFSFLFFSTTAAAAAAAGHDPVIIGFRGVLL